MAGNKWMTTVKTNYERKRGKIIKGSFKTSKKKI